MEFLNNFILFIEKILSMNIGLNNITILDLLLYIIFVSSVITFIKISVKGKKSR